MEKREVNALACRFKATTLLLMECNLFDLLEQNIEYAHCAFDTGKYEICKKTLDLIDAEVVEVLELTEV